jgi:hypothetical protein
MTQIPCIVESLDDETMRARMLKDNISYGDWNFEMLVEDFSKIEIEQMALPDNFTQDLDKFFKQKEILEQGPFLDAVSYVGEYITLENSEKENANKSREIKIRVPEKEYERTLERIHRMMNFYKMQTKAEFLFFALEQIEPAEKNS